MTLYGRLTGTLLRGRDATPTRTRKDGPDEARQESPGPA